MKRSTRLGLALLLAQPAAVQPQRAPTGHYLTVDGSRWAEGLAASIQSGVTGRAPTRS